jgi:hypothetical protein
MYTGENLVAENDVVVVTFKSVATPAALGQLTGQLPIEHLWFLRSPWPHPERRSAGPAHGH